jgi:cell division protein FtsI (penicillin-binding protein 3)
MAKPSARIGFLQVSLAIAAIAVVARAFVVQVEQHSIWEERATQRNVRPRVIPPTRGTIRDRSGIPLAATFDAYNISVALNELTDSTPAVAATRATLVSALGLEANEVAARFRKAAYPYFDGPFDASQVLPLRTIRGVHLERVVDREGRLGARAKPIVGEIDRTTGEGRSGIESFLDSLLSGRPGTERILVDGGGRRVTIPGGIITAPIPGQDVLLTIDHELQGIVESALEGAVAKFGAMGGDAVVVDVRSGEILSIASLRTTAVGRRPEPTPAALVEPYEPGSTAKIFTAAALLAFHADTTPVPGHDGEWQMEVAPDRYRTIRDTHREAGLLGLGETIKVSSNIAMSQFAMRLSPAQQFGMLRAFGFGTQPGTGFPVEAAGVLVPPGRKANLKYTMPSWAQGYELSTSSLQLAMAYAAIANGGVLLGPTLVKEIRDGTSGRLTWSHHADTVRRVVEPAVARQLMDYLALVTDSGGTGTGAQLDFRGVVGKTGTAKLDGGRDGYLREYRGSFAAIFPRDAPRFVVFVMIDRPGGSIIYGGEVAAPVVKAILQQAMVLPNSPLESGRLTPVVEIAAPAPFVPSPPVTSRVAFPVRAADVQEPAAVIVPELAGRSMREGLHLLARRGLVVRVIGRGAIDRTTPAAGTLLDAGSTVTVHASRGTDR